MDSADRVRAAHAAGEWLHPETRAQYLPRQVEGWGDVPAFRGALTAADLAVLDEIIEQDRQVSRCLVVERAEHAHQWGDLVSAVQALGYDGPLPCAEPVRGALGLSQFQQVARRPFSPLTPMRTLADGAQARAALRAFPVDSDEAGTRRLAQLRMHVGVAARLHCADAGDDANECLMITLTYAGTNEAWNPRHVSEFMKRVRQHLARRGLPCRYVWVAELQKRGVIHYHVALWVPVGCKLPKPDECGWWPHGMTRIEVARAAVPYLLKYLSKDTSKTFGRFPRGARLYGAGGLVHTERRTRRWLRLPAFVQSRSDVADDWRRRDGGGWTGPAPRDGVGPRQVLASEFQMARVGGRRCLRRVVDHGRPFDPSGPFSWVREPVHVG